MTTFLRFLGRPSPRRCPPHNAMKEGVESQKVVILTNDLNKSP